jgi:hypothetical protein
VVCSDAARDNRTCGKSTVRPHVRARAVNVRFFFFTDKHRKIEMSLQKKRGVQ